MKTAYIMASVCLSLLCLCGPAAQAAEQWQNAPAPKKDSFQSTLLLPDGQRRPVLIWPDGKVRYPDGGIPQERGQLVLPEGQIVELEPGGQIDTTLYPLPEAGMVPPPLEPQETALVPEEEKVVPPDAKAEAEKAEAEKAEANTQKESPHTPPLVLNPERAQAEAAKQEQARKDEKPAQAPSPLTLAGLLPTTPVSPAQVRKDEEKIKEDKAKQEAAAQKQEDKPHVNRPEVNRPEKAEAQKPKPEKPKQEQAKQEKPKTEKPRKPKPGDPLHIPEEAKKTGKVAFLEGCWQGIRPEYFSKRTIRECFCFGKNGQGKRYVIDKQGRRRCIGSTTARMQGETLAVTSSGAFCDDGEKWGASNMTCRGSGKKTPCSWIFTDAEGGRQAYEIPFTRVDSCRR